MTEHTLAAYGKLPLSKEFLRHGCYDGIGRDFKNWLDAGHDRFAGHPDRGQLADGNPRRFLFLPDGGGDMVVGVTINSCDASGGRRFPFAVFTALPRKAVHAAHGVTALAPLWKSLETELQTLAVLTDTDSFFAALRAERVPESAADAAVARSRFEEFTALRVHDWVDALYRYDPVDLWVRGLWRLKCMGPALAANARAPQLSAVRMPLARKLPLGPQIDVWRMLLGSLHASLQVLPTVVFPGQEDREPAVYLFCRNAEAGDFPSLVGADLKDDRFTDLVEAGGRLPVDGFGAFREHLERGPLATDASIASLAEFDLW